MGIEKVQLGNQVNFQNNIQQKPSFKGESEFVENPQDKEKSNAAKLMLGATAIAGLAILGIAGYKGHLGKGIQKFLGGTEKAVEKGNANLQETAEKAAKDAEAKAAKEAAEKAAKDAEAKAAKEAAEKAAKEAEAKAAKEAAEKAAKDAEAKAAKEAAEKAAKEAKEAAQKAYDAEMKEKLTPQVKQMIKDLHEKWSDEVTIASNLYEKAEIEGFKSLKKSGDTLKKLDNGALVITHKTLDGKKYQCISATNDTDKLAGIKVFKEDGELSHEVNFFRAYQKGRPIDIMADNHICFTTSGKTPRLVEWGNNSDDILASERLNHIQAGFGKYYVSYSGNEAKNVGANAFWLEV